MKLPDEVVDLIELRKHYGVFQQHPDVKRDIEIRSGHSRTIYPALGRTIGRWHYNGPAMPDDTAPTEAEFAARRTSNRSLTELEAAASEALTELLARAHGGKVEAAEAFARVTKNATESLDFLANSRCDLVGPFAERCARWPVMLSVNPQDQEAAIRLLTALRAGQCTPVPPYPTQHLDPHDLGTRLVGEALLVCQKLRVLIPHFLAHAEGAKATVLKLKAWDTKLDATEYRLECGDIILIPDWHRQCTELDEPIGESNWRDWWRVVSLCLVFHWRFKKSQSYAEILRRVGGNEPESRKRSLVLSRLRETFRALVVKRELAA